MKSRTLNSKGLELFENHLDSIRNGTDTDSTIDALLTDSAYSVPNSFGIEVSRKSFGLKKELAIYVCERIEASGLTVPPEDSGFWSWMAVRYFDSLLPASGRRSVAVRENARYVYNKRYNRSYRHRIAGPTRALWFYRNEPETVDLLLYGRPFDLNDNEEQILSRQQRIQNPSVVSLATRLYFDGSLGRQKRGSGNTKNMPGSLRRLLRVLEQYERTHDLYSMNVDEIFDWLPAEFDRWKS